LFCFWTWQSVVAQLTTNHWSLSWTTTLEENQTTTTRDIFPRGKKETNNTYFLKEKGAKIILLKMFPKESQFSTFVVLLSTFFLVALIFCPASDAVFSNLKYIKTVKTWQESENLHVILNTLTTLKDIECANYCTIRDSQFRKVAKNSNLQM